MENQIIHTDQFQLSQTDFVIRILVAIGIGLIIGLEREYSAKKEGAESFVGIRTLVFVSLLGFMGGMMYYLLTPIVYLVIFIAVFILIGISYYVTASKGDIGTTTEFSVLLVFILGSLSFLGFIEISLMVTVVTVVILSSKFRLHSIVGNISVEEFYDFIRFVVITLLIFPFLPNEFYGPYDVINPREIGLVIILTSGLGFVGYILIKLLGTQKGILLSGILGGLVSSTAITWVFSKKSRESPDIAHPCATAILAASSIMIIRVLIWTYIFNRVLFHEIYIAILIIFLIGMAVTLYFYFKESNQKLTTSNIPLGKPLDLQGAFSFGVIFAIILLVVSYANDQLGDKGIILSSGIAGLTDIDAITITVSKLTGVSLGLPLAANAVIVATISNTLVKMGISVWKGSAALRKDLYIGYGVVLISLFISLIFLN
ncbi:MgtC/SapB family protein [Shivajiella indica]|uniref:MgtC/SapB family protein n=1 Tax=Shivajiella indica TaxID=872115 RepID=A0ABW5B4D4_9BACT